MTTIVTDGDFLIADMRTSSPLVVPTAPRVHFKGQKVFRDTTCKIVIPINLWAGGQQVVAYAFSGATYLFRYFDNLAAYKDRVDLEGQAKLLNKTIGMSDNDTATGVFLLADGTQHLIWISVNQGGLSIRQQHLKKKGIFAYGSGSVVWSKLWLHANRPLTALQVFHFCAHTDKASSNNYSAYSREENKLFAAVFPPEIEVAEGVGSTHAALLLYNPKLKPMGSQLVFDE